MKGKYLTMDDAYKIANFDKLSERYRITESDNKLLKKIIKGKDKHYLKILEEKNYSLKNKQISF